VNRAYFLAVNTYVISLNCIKQIKHICGKLSRNCFLRNTKIEGYAIHFANYVFRIEVVLLSSKPYQAVSEFSIKVLHKVICQLRYAYSTYAVTAGTVNHLTTQIKPIGFKNVCLMCRHLYS